MSGLLQVPFFDDEVLASFVSRMARANGRSTKYEFCSDLGMSVSALNRGEDGAIHILSAAFGRNAEELSSRAVKSISNAYAIAAGAMFSRRSIVRGKYRYCPQCLAEDDLETTRMPRTRRYMRLHWMLTDAECCIYHDLALQEALAPASPHHRYDHCLVLGGPLSADIIPMKASPFDRFIYARTLGLAHHGALLDDLPLSSAIDLCKALGSSAYPACLAPGSATASPQARQATSDAFVLMTRGEDGLKTLLDQCVDLASVSTSNGAGALYGRVHDLLWGRQPLPEFEKIRRLVDIHKATAKPLRSVARRFSGPRRSGYASIAELAKATGISGVTVRSYLRPGSGSDGTRTTRQAMVSELDASEFVHLMGGTVRKKEAAAFLGCGLSLFEQLVEKGLIGARNPGREPGANRPVPHDRYKQSELEDFKATLQYAAQSEGGASMCTIRQANLRTGLPQTHFIRAVYEGGLRNVAYVRKALLIDSLLLDPTEFAVNNIEINGTAAEELSEQLRLRRRDLKCVAQAAGLQPYRSASRHSMLPAVYYRNSEIAAFRRQFVSISMLAEELGISTREIRKRMKARAIHPAFPFELVGCWVLNRQHIETIAGDL